MLASNTYLPVAPRIVARLMVAIVFIAVTVAVASLVKAPHYVASIKILVGLKGGGSWSWGDSPYERAQLTQATQTMSEAINTRPVSETVIGQLDLRVTPKEFLEKLTVEQIPETQFVHVSYADPSPQRAQRVANTVGEVVSKRVAEVNPSANTITATVWERAALPDDPVSPNPVRNGLLVVVLGLMLLGLRLIVGLAMSARGDVARGVGDSAHQMRRSVGPTASGTRGTPAGEPITEAAKEKELLEALGRLGELTAAGAALETSLTVEEAEGVLSGLAAKGHLRLRVRDGGIFYSFWQRDAPSE